MSAAKIDKTSLPGTTFGAENCFLVDFRVPEGPQKRSALGTDPMLCYGMLCAKGSGQKFGSHFEI